MAVSHHLILAPIRSMPAAAVVVRRRIHLVIGGAVVLQQQKTRAIISMESFAITINKMRKMRRRRRTKTRVITVERGGGKLNRGRHSAMPGNGCRG